MIFERREYRLRPGRSQAFWEAQREWNTPERYRALLDHCIAYCGAAAGTPERAVHFYRYESLDAWQAAHAAYYKAQSPDYFALVRPQLLRQDNTFFAAPPLPELAPLWAQPIDAARIRAAKGSDRPGFPLMLESTLAFFPGGLPAYWNAWSTQGADAPARKNLLGVQVALTGRLHRVACYHWFNDAAEAARHAESL
ncbi:MAG: NIPSNAP family protein, partial [Variibacter sp.]|nr:NIPSNAP family protein [Variibacter sp.]